MMIELIPIPHDLIVCEREQGNLLNVPERPELFPEVVLKVKEFGFIFPRYSSDMYEIKYQASKPHISIRSSVQIVYFSRVRPQIVDFVGSSWRGWKTIKPQGIVGIRTVFDDFYPILTYGESLWIS